MHFENGLADRFKHRIEEMALTFDGYFVGIGGRLAVLFTGWATSITTADQPSGTSFTADLMKSVDDGGRVTPFKASRYVPC